MFSPFLKSLGLAASPQGRKVIRQTVQFARSEEGKKVLEQARKVAANPETRKLMLQASLAARHIATNPEHQQRVKDATTRLLRERRGR